MASIKDVARKAGVAISTVSKVMNGYPGVSADMRKRVDEAVSELNFTPNAAASALSSKQSRRIAIFLNFTEKYQAADEIEMQYLAGAIHRARALKLNVVTLFSSMWEDKDPEEVINYLKAQGVEGIIVYRMARQDNLCRKVVDSGQFKVVVMEAAIEAENISCVCLDQKQAQYDVAKKTILENENCSRVLYIAGRKDSFVTGPRIEGIKALAEDLELELTIVYGDFSEKKARELTFAYADRADVFVCGSDLMAIGAMRALMDMDIFRPVCGFDGLTLMGYAGKQMNTVRQDFFGMSVSAVEELYGLMHGEKGRKLVPDYELVRMKYQDVIS